MHTYELCSNCNNTVDTERDEGWRRCSECGALLCKECKNLQCVVCHARYKESISHLKPQHNKDKT